MHGMSASGEWRCRAADVPPGRTATLRLVCGGRTLDGFVVHHGGGYRAWLNRCPHTGTPLDLWPNEFFSEDGRWLVCATHGAIFEPATGACTAGPCAGDALTALPLRREGDDIVVGCPQRSTARTSSRSAADASR
jgi:nitrite reductase/ring-hydroxylating ferredoxin subunit